MITSVSAGDVLPLTNYMWVAKKSIVQKNCKVPLNLARECHGDNNLKQKYVRPTKLVGFDSVAKHRNTNIILLLYEPKKIV